MAAPKLDSFQKALQRFKKALPPNLVDEFSICSLDDVRNTCREIQDAHGRNGTLRHMRRLEPFIEAMEQFGKVIEVFVNVNEIVCFVWGPMKFLLGVARTHIKSFDKLLDVYDKIGNAIPGLLQYQTAFEKYPPLATVLEDYYADILAFHQEALSVFRRPRWKELLHSTWKTFDSKFGPILQSMKNRHELLESEKVSATLYEVQRLRQDILDTRVKETNRTVQEDAEKHRREVCIVREKLEAPNYRIDQEMSTEDRHGHGSGTWIFEDPSFCSWSNKDASGHCVLYVNGIPGAGKTTLMSVVIEKLLEEKKDCVAYFYFKQKQPNKESHNSSLRALLLQLIERDSTVSDHLSEKMLSIESVNLRSTKVLESLVKTALETYRISYIVLDGLDECAPNEAAKSVKWFLSLINGGLTGTNVALRILFCGQRDGTLDKLLSEQPSISLEVSGHVEDIRQYCRGFATRIREKFQIPPEMEEEIIQKVTNEAQGMFLYARVVMENLWNQTRRSRLKKEIEPGIFPQGIEKAYERVAVRIFGMSSMAEREDAKKIMGWVICARRLLRWREIQSLFCIDPVNGDVDYEERRLRVTCKELCGSLVDIHHVSNDRASPEDVVKIVHETAREYLIQRKWLNAGLEHTRLAIFCARYLMSTPLACGINEEDITTHAIEGYYALQDYVVQFWFDHFQACAESIAELDPDIYLEAMSNAKAVLVAYGLPSKMKRLSNTQGDEEVAKTLAGLPTDGYERNAYFNIEYRTTMIRNVIETLDRQALHPTVREILANLQGNIASYKCSKPWCESFTAGFGNAEDRKQHADRHDRPFRCPSNNCFASRLGYDTRAKLDQHQKSHHPDPDNDEIRFPKIATKKKATAWTAAAQGDLATISSLLDSGTGVNRSNGGEPLIYIASKSGHFEICKLLLQRGANVNLPKRQDGRTALHAAVVAGNRDIVHLLISHKSCDPDQADEHGRSPFCEACALGHLDIVKLLIENGSIKTHQQPRRHPECCNGESYTLTLTPLGYACGQGHLAVVQYLLQQGQSDLVSIDIIERASRQGHEDIVNLLRPIMAELGLSFDHAPSRLISEIDEISVVFNPVIPLALDIELANTLHCGSDVDFVQFSADGKRLAFGQTFSVQIYNLATGEVQLLRISDLGQPASVRALCLSPDGKYLAAGGDESIEIWDVATKTKFRILQGSRQPIRSLSFAHDNRTIASVDSNGTTHLWDINTLSLLANISIGGSVNLCAISPDTKLVAANDSGKGIQVWNIKTNECIGSVGRSEWIARIAFSPNGRSLVSASHDTNPDNDCIIKMWNLGAFRKGLEVGSCIKKFKGHRAFIRSVAFTSDAQWVISASSDGEVRFWDSHTGETQLMIRGHKGSVGPIATSPTSNYFATTSDYGVHIWSYTPI
ncbi:WD40 repeat-like protein [Xylaria cubensis]|nr:WD40 repeat-like protein [Xylaria cubensis]